MDSYWRLYGMNDQTQQNLLTDPLYDPDQFVTNDLPLPQSAANRDDDFFGSDSAELKSQQQEGSLSPATETSIDDMPQTPLPEGPEAMTIQSSWIGLSYASEVLELLNLQPLAQPAKDEETSPCGLVQAHPLATANTGPPTAPSLKATFASSAAVLEHNQASSVPAVLDSSRQIQIAGTLAPSTTATSAASAVRNSKDQVQVMGNQSFNLPATSIGSAAPAGSAHLRQDDTFVPSVKTIVVKRGVKRKNDQVQEEEVEKEKKIAGGSAVISRNEKNAQAARENRLKKKKEMDDLKNLTSSLEEENRSLRKDNVEQSQTIKELRDQLDNLKSVLVNQSQLSEFLRSMNPTPQLRLGSSMGAFSGSRANSPQGMTSGGVCLHVNGGPSASLEFCPKCSQSAQASLNK